MWLSSACEDGWSSTSSSSPTSSEKWAEEEAGGAAAEDGETGAGRGSRRTGSVEEADSTEYGSSQRSSMERESCSGEGGVGEGVDCSAPMAVAGRREAGDGVAEKCNAPGRELALRRISVRCHGRARRGASSDEEDEGSD